MRSIVRTALLTDPTTESRQIQVAAQTDGAVNLSGTVESWAERDAAEQVAKGISGVTAVRNDIEVDYAPSRADPELSADIERLLHWDAYLGDTDIDVSVNKGAVVLTGTTDSSAEKSHAGRLAWIGGTKSVDVNGVQVASSGATPRPRKQREAGASDQDIAAAVRSRLELSAAVSNPVDVEVVRGTATLHGAVATLEAKRKAAALASQVAGVERVENELQVASAGNVPGDDDLQERVASALQDDLVAGTRGVRAINNSLQVPRLRKRPPHKTNAPLTWPIHLCKCFPSTSHAGGRMLCSPTGRAATMLTRRKFCHTTAAAGIAVAHPLIAACGRSARNGPAVAAVSLDGEPMELERAAVAELANGLDGRLLLPDHTDYDTARRIWNGMHDKRPALIAQCASTQDVSDAVAFALERRLLVAVRGGGHSWPGKSVCDGGLMIDLSAMNEVTVHAGTRRAHAEGGALLNRLDTRSLEHGLVTTAGVVSHTGVGGFTLGGGFGRLNRKYGLAIDNLMAADIITADAKLRTVSEQQERDLFWALRGGGGNFGVVTRFEYRLHPFQRRLLSGMLVWPIEDARAVLDFYGDWYLGLSDELYAAPAMLTMPDGKSVIAMEVVYNGDPAAGERELAELRRIGKPQDGIKMQDYMVMQTQEDATFAHGLRSYAKNGMVEEVTADLIAAMVESFPADPRLALFTHTAGGAVKRVGGLATAFPHRKAETMLVIGAVWKNPAADQEVIAKLRSWFNALEPFTVGYYDNIEFDRDDPQVETYGPAYPRLRKVKALYDPTNLFRLNNNIEPATV